MKGKDPEIGSEGKKKGGEEKKNREKKPTTLRTLARIPILIFENTQFFPKCFHCVER